MGRFPASLFLLAPFAPPAFGQAPELYLMYTDSQPKQVRLGAQPVRVPGNQRIRLAVTLDSGNLREPVEQPEVKAENQAPGYFSARPPANVALRVRLLRPQGPQEVSVRVYSSGLGKNLNTYFVNADLDIIADQAEHDAKFREFVSRIMERAKQESPEQAARLLGPQSIDAMTRYLAETDLAYIHPGEYEITAYYTPTTADHWRGRLVSKPARITVYEAGYKLP
jgi:hypothetical protein